jgi:hypothetical protein
MFQMLDENMDKIIDSYMLAFLDDFEVTYKRLPNEEEKRLWMIGFINGCEAIGEAIQPTLFREGY